MKRYFVTAGLVAAGLLSGVGLAACGGDDTPETPIVVTDQQQQLTKEEFISQADAICAEANTAIADIAAAGEGITRAADVADLRQGVVTDIRDLGRPVDDTSAPDTSTDIGTDTAAEPEDTSTFPGDETDTSAEGIGSGTGTGPEEDTVASGTGQEDELEVFLAAMLEQVKAGQKIDLASQRGETTADAEAELEAAKEEAAAAATSYGFEECGTEGTPSGESTVEDSTSGTSVAPSAPSAPAPSAPAPAPDTGGDTGGGVSPGGGVAPE